MTTKPKTTRRLASGLNVSKRVSEASISREIAEGAKFFWSSRGGNPNGIYQLFQTRDSPVLGLDLIPKEKK